MQKLMEWSKKKFQGKINEKISSEIALSQVELATKIEKVKKVLESIFSLYTKLCNPTLFTQETNFHILSLESQISSSSAKLPMNPTQSEKHFRTFLQTQSQLVVLTIDEANIRAKLTSIQTTLTLHMEIVYKEIGYVETLLKKTQIFLHQMVQFTLLLSLQSKSSHWMQHVRTGMKLLRRYQMSINPFQTNI